VTRGYLTGRQCPFLIAFLKNETLTDSLQISGGNRNNLSKMKTLNFMAIELDLF